MSVSDREADENSLFTGEMLSYELCNLDLIWRACLLSICVLPQDDPAFCHIAPDCSREGTVLCLL